MVDIGKQVEYWRTGAAEALDVARQLVESGRTNYGLFFAHLTLEKALKALVCRKTGDLAPRIHNLVRLCEAAGLEPDPELTAFLGVVNTFNIEGRYPEILAPAPSREEAEKHLAKVEETYKWLTTL